jgi:hypothetical protein
MKRSAKRASVGTSLGRSSLASPPLMRRWFSATQSANRSRAFGFTDYAAARGQKIRIVRPAFGVDSSRDREALPHQHHPDRGHARECHGLRQSGMVRRYHATQLIKNRMWRASS